MKKLVVIIVGCLMVAATIVGCQNPEAPHRNKNVHK